jgi:hypothetical protein
VVLGEGIAATDGARLQPWQISFSLAGL